MRFSEINYCSTLVKRAFDIVFSLFSLILLSPIIVIAFIVSSIEVNSNGFFLQERVGKGGAVFKIIKIKTMKDASNNQSSVAIMSSVRITKIGVFFRRMKIDELPQLWNVLIGEMSFVGPRPDVPGYADKLKGKDKKILSVRPGITGPAQLYYKNEEEVLKKLKDPIKHNNEIIWPDKVKINLLYIENCSFFTDVYYIWKTLVGGNVRH